MPECCDSPGNIIQPTPQFFVAMPLSFGEVCEDSKRRRNDESGRLNEVD
jgi:hypothetical protein